MLRLEISLIHWYKLGCSWFDNINYYEHIHCICIISNVNLIAVLIFENILINVQHEGSWKDLLLRIFLGSNQQSQRFFFPININKDFINLRNCYIRRRGLNKRGLFLDKGRIHEVIFHGLFILLSSDSIGFHFMVSRTEFMSSLIVKVESMFGNDLMISFSDGFRTSFKDDVVVRHVSWCDLMCF